MRATPWPDLVEAPRRPSIIQRLAAAAVVAILWLFGPNLHAHDLPISRVRLHVDDYGIDATVEAPAIDFAHDLPEVTPDILLTPAGARFQLGDAAPGISAYRPRDRI